MLANSSGGRGPRFGLRMLLVVLVGGPSLGCVAPEVLPSANGGASATGGAPGPGTGGAPATGGATASGGATGSGGATASGGATGSGGAATGGMAATGGAPTTGGSSGAMGAGGRNGGATGTAGGGGGGGGRGGVTAGTGGAAGRSGAGGANNCNLPATVSYQKDVQPFLITSCGGGNGCHVIDAQSTVGSGGFNHGYDWITAGSHTSSCPSGPMRFEIVIDVINAANPASCSKSRKMPPPNATGAGVRTPLTVCQIATLQAWLNEPKVTQTHRADDSSPTTPYPMPPFN